MRRRRQKLRTIECKLKLAGLIRCIRAAHGMVATLVIEDDTVVALQHRLCIGVVGSTVSEREIVARRIVQAHFVNYRRLVYVHVAAHHGAA